MWAALEKARNPSAMAQTAGSLGVPERLQSAAAVLVPACEIGAVAAIVDGIPRQAAAGLLMSFGFVFAAAALFSMATGRRVACACFGVSSHNLGWRQILALPLWGMAGVAALYLPDSTVRTRTMILAFSMLFLAALRSGPTLREGMAARGDRRAIRRVRPQRLEQEPQGGQ
jgi:hypothetical protein